MMKTAYHIDPSQISLQLLKDHLLGRDLIPSRRPLKVGLDDNLAALERIGIVAVDGLISALRNKDKLKEVSRKTGIAEEYLTLLRREANSYFPSPVPISKFPDISPETGLDLADQGIKNSKQLFEIGQQDQGLTLLAGETKIPIEILKRLYGLADLARAYGVGPIFADLLYNGGIRSLEAFLAHTPAEIVDLYQDKTGKKADFSLGDLEFSQTVAGLLYSK